MMLSRDDIINELAKEVMNGRYGDETERRNNLKNAGFTDFEIDDIEARIVTIIENNAKKKKPPIRDLIHIAICAISIIVEILVIGATMSLLKILMLVFEFAEAPAVVFGLWVLTILLTIVALLFAGMLIWIIIKTIKKIKDRKRR